MKNYHKAGDPMSKILPTAMGQKAFAAEWVKDKCAAVGVEYRKGDEKNVVQYIASTQNADREGDVMVMSGGDFKEFLTNPVFIWAHDLQEIPLGSVIDLKIEGNKLLATVLYHCITEISKDMCALALTGHIKGVSLGFRSKMNGIKFPTEQERNGLGMRPGGVIFQAWELYELSQCPVGMNSEALKVRSLNKKTIALLKGEDPSNISEVDPSNANDEDVNMTPDEVKKAIADGITEAIPGIIAAVKAAPAPVVPPVNTERETPAPNKALEALIKGNPKIYGPAQKSAFDTVMDRVNGVTA